VGNHLSEVDRAYLAGFLDGDGAIMAVIEPHPEKRFGFRVRIEISITQRHESGVCWIPQLAGVGYTRRNLETYQWVVRDQQAARWFLTMIQPFSRCKSEQIALAIRILEHPRLSRDDLIQVARLADSLSKLNARSRNRRKNHAAMVEESPVP